jgi:hypothetical protein
MRHGFTRFMRAHGQVPGPGERPRLAGAIAGTLAGMISLAVLIASGADQELARGLSMQRWTTGLLYCLIWLLAGVAYALVFGRAANDRRGGWLFGIAYGFLLWMLGPVALLQAVLGRQLVTGTAAMGVLGANLVSGLFLGLCFHFFYTLLRRPHRRSASVRHPVVAESRQ